MGNENYKGWYPIREKPSDLYFDKLLHKSNELNIFFKAFDFDDKKLKISFKGILIYKVSLEIGRMATIHQNAPMNTFGISETSSFLDWFKQDSCGVFEDQKLVHIVICSSDNLLDIITDEYPIVEWIPDSMVNP
jgi:hypothetical protein